MLKLYAEQKNSIYSLQKKIGCGKDTLYKYARKEVNIDNMKVDIILKIAHLEQIEVNELSRKMKEYLI